MPPFFRKPYFIISMTLFTGAMAWSVFTSLTDTTEVTLEVVLRPSGEVITELAQINAYETYFPQTAAERAEGYPQYGPIFLADERPNVYEVPNGVPAGFEATVGATVVGPIGTTGGVSATRTVTLSTHDGLVRLTVQTDSDAPGFFVQAASDPASGTFEAQSQGVPEDGQMLFLLPEGDWTFSALDDGLDQTLVVTVPEGDIVDATLDLRTAD